MLIPNGYGQVNFIFTGTNLPTGAEMTFGIDVTGYGGDPAAAAADIQTENIAAAIDDMYVNSQELVAILVKYGPNATGPSALVPVSLVGNQATASAGPNTAALIHKQTAFGGRAGRGRMYLPGIPENSIENNGALSSGYFTAWDTVWDALRIGLASVDLPMVLLHDAGSPITTPTPITSLVLDPTTATQRRRLRR